MFRRTIRVFFTMFSNVVNTMPSSALDILDEFVRAARARGPLRTAVVNPTDELSLGGALAAQNAGLIEPILVGDADAGATGLLTEAASPCALVALDPFFRVLVERDS